MAVARELVLSKAFVKSYKKFSGKNRALQSSIDNTLIKLEQDIYDPILRTHKLGGKLAAYMACSCGYDCRIFFPNLALVCSAGQKCGVLVPR